MAARWNVSTLQWRPVNQFNDPQTVTGYTDGSGLGFFNVPCVKRKWRIVHVESGFELSGAAVFTSMKKAQAACEAIVALDLDFNRPRSAFGSVTGNAVFAKLRELGVSV